MKDSREREVVHVLDRGDGRASDRHVRERRVVQRLVAVPVHREDACMSAQPVAAARERTIRWNASKAARAWRRDGDEHT